MRVAALRALAKTDEASRATDTEALIDAGLAGEVPREVLVPHLPTLNKLLRQQGGLFRAAGTRVEEDETVVVR